MDTGAVTHLDVSGIYLDLFINYEGGDRIARGELEALEMEDLLKFVRSRETFTTMTRTTTMRVNIPIIYCWRFTITRLRSTTCLRYPVQESYIRLCLNLES